jgi:hypothetical protein
MSTPGVGYVVEVIDPRASIEARLYGLFQEQARAVAFARQVAAHLINHNRPVKTRVRMLWPPSMTSVERWWLA